MNNTIHGSEWEDYLDSLYDWVNSRLTAYQEGEISKEEYYKDYDYFKMELKRVYSIIEDERKRREKNPTEKIEPQVIKPDLIFQYFYGEEKKEIIEEDSKETISEIPEESIQAQEKIVESQSQKPLFEAIKKVQSKKKHTPTNQNYTQIQIVLLGESAVGRTSLRRAFLGKHFINEHLSTVGAAMEDKIITVENEHFKITLVDLGGQDFYAPVRANFYKKANGALLVFDLSRKNTFIKLDSWLREFFMHTKRGLPFIIVGNKSDLKRAVKREEGIQLAESLSRQTMHAGFEVKYFETSAKERINVDEVFLELIRQIKHFNHGKKQMSN